MISTGRLEASLGKVIADNTVINEVLPEIKRLAPGSTPRLSVNAPCPCAYPSPIPAAERPPKLWP